MQKSRPLFFALLLFVLSAACSKEPDSSSSLMQSNLDISQPRIVNSASAKGSVQVEVQFNKLPEAEVIEYGVVWYQEETNDMKQLCMFPVAGAPRKNVKIDVTTPFPLEQSVYLRGYLRTEKEVIYGPYCAYKHTGSVGEIQIESVNPLNIRALATIKIEGKNFLRTKNPRYQQVLINDKIELIVDSVTDTRIWCRIPKEYLKLENWNSEGTFTVRQISNSATTSESSRILSPWRELPFPDFLAYGGLTRGSAAVKGNYAYMLMMGSKNMMIYDIVRSSWSMVSFPGQTIEWYEYSFRNPNFYCFNHADAIYVANNRQVYRLDDRTFTLVSELPGISDSGFADTYAPFYYYADGYLYVGAFRGERFFSRYHLESDTWEPLLPLPAMALNTSYPQYVSNPNCFMYDGGDHLAIAGCGSYEKDIYRYSKINGNWSLDTTESYKELAFEYNSPSYESFMIDKKAYVVVGDNHDWNYSVTGSTLRRKADGEWQMLPSCPKGYDSRVVFVHENKAYILGFDKGDGKYFYVFDPAYL